MTDNKKIFIPGILGVLFALLYFILPIEYLFIGIVGLLGLVLILCNIKIGLMAAVAIIPFMPDMIGLLFMFFILAIFLFNEMFKERQKLKTHKMDLPIIIFVIIIIFSTITSIIPGTDGSLRDLALHLGGISFLFVMIHSIENRQDLNSIITVMVFIATLVSLYGLYQYIVGVELDAAWVDVENNPDVKTRVFSVFNNPNILAEYLIMTIPLSVALFWHTKKLSKKIVFLITSGIMSLALVLTLSRGGWLGFAFSALIFILLIEKKLLLLSVPMVIGGVYFLPQSIINRILSIGNLADSSNAYRLKIWEITGQIIEDNWMAGVGFGHLPFKHTFETYIRTMPTYHAHNTFLELAAEIGLPGLITFLFMMFVIFKYGILILNKSENRYSKVMGAGIIAGLGGLMLHGAVENVLYIPRIIITFWMMISFVMTLVRIEEKEILEKLN